MKTGVELIADERRRQVEEKGWTAEHDDTHGDGSLVSLASFVAYPPSAYKANIPLPVWASRAADHICCEKYPDDRIRQLSIAGALIAAEIDRLQRAARP